MGQYFCQALGALKSHPVEDTACEQETETKQETKSDASSDRCVRYIHVHVCTCRMVEWCHGSIMFEVYVYVQCCECVCPTLQLELESYVRLVGTLITAILISLIT